VLALDILVVNTKKGNKMKLLWIKIQVRMIKWKVSVLTWQFERLMSKLTKKIASTEL